MDANTCVLKFTLRKEAMKIKKANIVLFTLTLIASFAKTAVAGFVDLTTTYVPGGISNGYDNVCIVDFNNDGNWNFTDVTTLEGLPSNLGETYGAAWGDINGDGFIDLITNNKLFINQGNANSWLKVRLMGDGVTVNRSAIGAQVRIALSNKRNMFGRCGSDNSGGVRHRPAGCWYIQCDYYSQQCGCDQLAADYHCNPDC